MYRKELQKFPPKGTVNQAKAAAAAVEKEQKLKAPTVAPKPKPTKEKVKMKVELELELTPDEIVKMLEDMEEFQIKVLHRKPPMWQQMKKKTKEAAGLVKP